MQQLDRVLVKPRSCDHGWRENNAFTLLAMLRTSLVMSDVLFLYAETLNCSAR